MKKIFLALYICIFFLPIMGSVAFATEPVVLESQNKGPYDTNNFLITFDKAKVDLQTESGRQKAKEFVASQDRWEIVAFVEYQNLAVIYVPAATNSDARKPYGDIDSAIKAVKDSGLGKAQYNIYYHTAFDPGDPGFKFQESFYQKIVFNGREMGFLANEAWDKTERKVFENSKMSKDKFVKQDVLIALIDVGLRKEDFQNKDLQGIIYKSSSGSCADYNGRSVKCPYGGIDIWSYMNFGSANDGYVQSFGKSRHAPVMARIMAGVGGNGYGYAGINNIVSTKNEPMLQIMPIKVGSMADKEKKQASGDIYISSAQLIGALHFARMNGVDLALMPIAKNLTAKAEDVALREAIQIVGNSGIFVITPDWGVCDKKLPKIVASYLVNGKTVSFNSLICAAHLPLTEEFWNGKFKKEINPEKKVKTITIDLKDSGYLDLRQMPSRSEHEEANGGAVDILASGEYPEFIFEPEENRGMYSFFSDMTDSTASAFVTGAMAHMLRFGLVSKQEKALLRCITENASDELMTLGYKNGELSKILSLKRMVDLAGKFSNNLGKCQDYEKSRQAIPGIIAKINKFSASAKGKGYEYRLEFEVPNTSGNIEYIVVADTEGGAQSGFLKVGNVSEENNHFTTIWAYNSLAEFFLQSKHCVEVYARNVNSVLVGRSQIMCLTGTQLIYGQDALALDAKIDTKYLSDSLDTKDETAMKVDLVLSGGSPSTIGDLTIETRWQDACEEFYVPDTASKKSLAILEGNKRIGKPLKFANIKFDASGKWSKSIIIPFSPMSHVYSISATFKFQNGREQKLEKTINVSGTDLYDQYDVNLDFEACPWLARQGKTKFTLNYAARFPYREVKKDAFLEFSLPEGVKLVSYDKRKAQEITSLRSKNNFRLFVKNESMSTLARFSAELEISEDIQKKLVNNWLLSPYPDSRFYFLNKAGIPIEFAVFHLLSPDNLIIQEDLDAQKKNDLPLQTKPAATAPKIFNQANSSIFTLTPDKIGLPKESYALQASIKPNLTDLKAKGFFEFSLAKSKDKTIRFYTNSVKANSFVINSKQIRFPSATYCIRPGITLSNGSTVLGDSRCSDGTTQAAISIPTNGAMDR